MMGPAGIPMDVPPRGVIVSPPVKDLPYQFPCPSHQGHQPRTSQRIHDTSTSLLVLIVFFFVFVFLFFRGPISPLDRVTVLAHVIILIVIMFEGQGKGRL